MYTQKSTLQRVIEQFRFSQLEALLHIIFQGGTVLYAFYNELEKSSAEVREFGMFFENTVTRVFSETIGEAIVVIATANVATMVFWAVVGAFVYVIVMAALSMARGAGFTLVSALQYKHPRGFNTKRYLADIILEKLGFLMIAFVFILYSASLINSLIPFVFERVSYYITLASLRSVWIVAYIAVLTFALHVWFVLLRIVRGMHKHQDAEILQST